MSGAGPPPQGSDPGAISCPGATSQAPPRVSPGEPSLRAGEPAPVPGSWPSDPLAETEAIPTEPEVRPHRTCKPRPPPVPCARCGRELDGTEVQCEARVFCLDCALVELDR